jgi:cysteine desulfurase/selenocysteine lyase
MMGFKPAPESVPSEQPLWQQYRDQFPVTKELIYLNHAAVSPLCKPAADAMHRLTEDTHRFGSLHYDEWVDAYEGLRVAAARLIGAERGEIALVKNTSEGISTVALGFDWRPGDRIVAFTEEFPANFFSWKRLEARRVTVDWLSIHDPLNVIERACHGARLLAISYVQYLSGFRANLSAIGRACKKNGCFFFVDAIQGLGALPLNVRELNIDGLAADGHKWMLGPEGCGILYVRKEWQDRINPMEFGWLNVAAYNDYGSRDMTLRPDAGRYECGTLNTVGCHGLRAAIEFLLEVGVDRIGPAVLSLTDRLVEGALRRDYQLLGERTPENASGIVCMHKPGMDARATVRRLKDQGILAAPRQGWIRMSPHFYLSPEEIDHVVDALP